GDLDVLPVGVGSREHAGRYPALTGLVARAGTSADEAAVSAPAGWGSAVDERAVSGFAPPAGPAGVDAETDPSPQRDDACPLRRARVADVARGSPVAPGFFTAGTRRRAFQRPIVRIESRVVSPRINRRVRDRIERAGHGARVDVREQLTQI